MLDIPPKYQDKINPVFFYLWYVITLMFLIMPGKYQKQNKNINKFEQFLYNFHLDAQQTEIV